MNTLDGNNPYLKINNIGSNIYIIDTNILSLDIPISDKENPIVDFSLLKYKDNDSKIYFVNDGIRYDYLYKDGDDYRLRNTILSGITSIVINDVNKSYRFDIGKIINGSITLITPIDSGTIIKDIPMEISWSRVKLDGSTVKVEYYDGSSWNVLASSVPVENLGYNWTAPDNVGSDRKIKISVNGEPELVDEHIFDIANTESDTKSIKVNTGFINKQNDTKSIKVNTGIGIA